MRPSTKIEILDDFGRKKETLLRYVEYALVSQAKINQYIKIQNQMKVIFKREL